MAPLTNQSSKPVFKTSLPFTETKWQEISPDDQNIILDLTCNLLAPLGDHRRTHIHPSKGQKRKRSTNTSKNDDFINGTPPPPPEIGKHILVGINSVTRHLEALAAENAPPTAPLNRDTNSPRNPHDNKKGPCQNGDIKAPDPNDDTKDANPPNKPLNPLSILLLTHPKPSLSPAHAHLPTLIYLTTLSQRPPTTSPTTSPTTPTPPTTPTLLIPLPTAADARLASILHIPRVGALALFADAPGARALEEFVRARVRPTECRWIDEAVRAEWRGLNVVSEMVGGKEKGKGKGKNAGGDKK
ncbi:hypothetical protein IQ07DRAFT_622827 [Pyrenochaeta sp. DS3sAY3a]|nr:hypothetical protein IQ07DRAFT_622827 [Pyrenochaeta sp. DS3sAY3a]